MKLLNFCMWMLVVAGLFGGCAAREISVSTIADRTHQFPAEPLGAAYVVMVDDETGAAIDRSALSLEQRNVLVGVQEALIGRGFLLADQPSADLVWTVSTFLESGERDSYRTVPVQEHTHGTISTRDGPRRFHGTTSTSVVVPQRVEYTDRFIVIAATPGDAVEQLDRIDEDRAVWIGRVRGSRAAIDEDVTTAVSKLLEYWGQTAARRVRY